MKATLRLRGSVRKIFQKKNELIPEHQIPSVIQAETLYVGGNVINQFGLDPTPASFKHRVSNLLNFYLGTLEAPVPFGGRNAEIEWLNDWLGNPQQPSNLLLTATAARGKTALLVHWIEQVASAWPVAFAPISIRFDTNRASVFYQAMAYQLASILDERLPSTPHDAADFYKDKSAEYVHKIQNSGKRCLLVIDGLDETAGWEIDESLLPRIPPENLKIVVSARQLAGDEGPSDWLHRLGWVPPRSATTLEVPPLDKAGIRDVLHKMGIPPASPAADVDVVGELYRLTEWGDPLLLRLYVDDLWQLGAEAARLDAEGLKALQPGYGPFFRKSIEDQKRLWRKSGVEVDEQAINKVWLVLSCALGPLKLNELESLLSDSMAGHYLVTSDIVEPLRRFVIGAPKTGYALAHPKLADYLQSEHLGSNAADQMRQRFVEWGRDVVHKLNNGELPANKAPTYALMHYSQHLARETASPQYWRELVEDGWRKAWLEFDGGFQGFARDVALASEQLSSEANKHAEVLTSPLIGLGGQIRCALCLSSIRSIGLRMPSVVLEQAVRRGLLSPKRAFHLAQSKHASEDQGLALTKLAPHLSPELLAEALDTAKAIDDEWVRAGTLAALAERLRPKLLADVLDKARAINLDWACATIVGVLAKRLPPELLTQAFEAAKAIDNESDRVRALAALAPRLSPELLTKALQTTEAIGDDHDRVRLLVALAAYLSETDRTAALSRALEAARAIRCRKGARARALAELAPHLPKSELAPHLPKSDRASVRSEALEAGRAIGDERARATTLAALAAHLPKADRTGVLSEALNAAKAILWYKKDAQAEALATVALHLPEADRTAVLAGALKAVKSIEDEGDCAIALATLAQHLPLELSAEALKVAKAITYEGARAEALAALAPHLSPELLTQAFEAARAIGDENDRVRVLVGLAQRLPEADRLGVLSEALGAAKTIGDENDRVSALDTLAPHLPETDRRGVLSKALAAARAVGDEGARARALAALAPHLSKADRPGVLTEALEATKAIDYDESVPAEPLDTVPLHQRRDVIKAILGRWVRGSALVALAPHLPEADRSSLLFEALNATKAISDMGARARALTALVPRLPKADPSGILSEALKAAKAIDNERDRVTALAALAPALPEADRLGVLTEALEGANLIDDGRDRVKALAALYPHLPKRERPGALSDALKAVNAIGDKNERAKALVTLVPYLSPQRLAEAHAAVKAIDDVGARARALVALAAHLPETDLSEALEAAKAIDNKHHCARTLALVARHMPNQQPNREAISAMVGAIGQSSRGVALSCLELAVPALREIGGETGLREVTDAIHDVAVWWP